MSILLTTVIFFLTVFISKIIFLKWFNHLSVYSLGWAVFIILFEFKLMPYINLSSETYFIFFITQIGIISGAVTVYLARKAFNKEIVKVNPTITSFFLQNNLKTLKYFILITSLIGLYSAYQHWMVLIDKFGSITTVLIRANLIYRMRVAGEIEGVIPYLFIFPYAGIVLGGVYSAIKNKITFISLLPLLAIILKDMASIGRGGIFFSFLLFIISFFLFRHSLSDKSNYYSFKNKKSLIITSVVIVFIVVGSLSLVKEIRGSFEDFKGKSQTFNKFKDVPIISPSLYLYFSSNVGVFSRYYDLQLENPMIGENTFLPIYNLLSKFGILDHPEFYPRGYNIPMWTNSATYLKDLHADFGHLGLLLIPYFLSFLASFYWYRFYEKGSLTSFVILVYLHSILDFSVFFMISRAAFWFLSFIFLLIFIPISEEILKRIKNRNYNAALLIE